MTIPVGIRRKLGLTEGDSVVFREVDGEIIIHPATRAVTTTSGAFRSYATGRTLTADELRAAAAVGLADESHERASR